ncbi:MAG: nuclease-related domain-containing protein [Anaerolineae bacterium]|nr:nuclease-related domain-containing protein [Anaerolineae bacterium]
MQNIVPARSLARRSRNLLLGAVLIILLGILLIVASVFMQTVRLVVPSNPNYSLYTFATSALAWLGGLLILLGIVMVIRAVTWKRDNILAQQIADALDDFLDKKYVYIRNLSRFAIGYVDAVLVGPPGVLVFRITQKGGTFYNKGQYWLKQKDKDDWQSLRWSPTKECVDDIKKIREFLAARGLESVPVFGVVVFTEEAPETRVTLENPTVPVLQPRELSYGLVDTYLSNTKRIDIPTVTRVVNILYE